MHPASDYDRNVNRDLVAGDDGAAGHSVHQRDDRLDFGGEAAIAAGSQLGHYRIAANLPKWARRSGQIVGCSEAI